MQGCERFAGILYEGVATPEVSAHVAVCESCRRLAEHLGQIDQSAHFSIQLDPGYVAFRKQLIMQKLSTVTPEPRFAWAFRLARLAAVALFAFLLFRPYQPVPTQPALPTQMALQTPINFELVKNGDLVELRWKGDPQQLYRVLKGPNPGRLSPVQQVKGVAWVDPAPDSSPILFYKIEAL